MTSLSLLAGRTVIALSSFDFISLTKRENLLFHFEFLLSSDIASVLCLFLDVPWVGLWSVAFSWLLLQYSIAF